MTVDKSDRNADKPSEFRKLAKSYSSAWVYAEYAVQYGMSIVLCSLIGYWLDNKFDSGNTYLIIGVIVGSVGGFINLLRGLTGKAKKS